MQSKRVPVASTTTLSGPIYALLAIAVLATASASAQEKLLHSFTPKGSDGAYSYASLISDAAGNRYGTTSSGGTYNGGTVFELLPRQGGGWTERVLYSFKTFGGDGFNPNGSLVFDTKGNLYGTTTDGGSSACITGCGTVFELSPRQGGGWTESVLYSFNSTGTDGTYPSAGLIFDTAGNLYGTTLSGGDYYDYGGTVFELSPKHGGGWTETVLYGFSTGGVDAVNPESPLTFDAHGNLYGVAQSGGLNFDGAVFELSPKQGGGWTETVLYSFCMQPGCTDGWQPATGGLVTDSAGNLYGTTLYGGAYSGGTVFELSPQSGGTWTESVLHSFGQGTDGNDPAWSTLIFGPDDHLFGATVRGGLYGLGTVFELSPRRGGGWTETVLYNFDNSGTSPWLPYAGLLLDEYGNLFGTTAGGGGGDVGAVFEVSPRGGGRWKTAVLHNFKFSGTDGAGPQYAPLVLDAQGNLYGTTATGGTYDNGTVYELKSSGNGSWTEELLYSFGATGKDGSAPFAGLVFDAHGNLYGTTASGGAYGQGGTVFELSPNGSGGWTEKVLHSFQNNGTDGYQPLAGVVFDAAGNLYGTTYIGGTYGLGTVFELSPNGSGGWTEQVIYSFSFLNNDGLLPYAGLVIDSKGNLYGTTYTGGLSFAGTVFEVSPDGQGGWTENVLYNFCSQTTCTDGSTPYGDLILDAAHNLYGTTYYLGASGGGTVFRLTPQSGGTWTETVLYSFCAQSKCADGQFPFSGLTFSGSNLYGTTSYGGANGDGVVFELAPAQGGNWTETLLHSFNLSGGDGGYPSAGVSFDPSGNLYGVTYYGGGNYNAGTVFELESVSRRLTDAAAFRR